MDIRLLRLRPARINTVRSTDIPTDLQRGTSSKLIDAEGSRVEKTIESDKNHKTLRQRHKHADVNSMVTQN